MYDRVMVVIASWIVRGPLDDGDIVVGNFECRPLEYLDVLGLLRRRKVLSKGGAAKEQAA